MTTAQVKPCPFCNGEMLPNPYGFIHAPDSDCWLRSIQIAPREFESWNRRAPIECGSVPDADIKERLRDKAATMDAVDFVICAKLYRDAADYIAKLEGQLSAQTAEPVSMTAQELANRVRNGETWKVAETRLRGSHIKGTWAHGAGAYACCSYCGRYSDNPCALSLRSFRCDCGKETGWSGSFVPPTAESTWSGPESGISLLAGRLNEQAFDLAWSQADESKQIDQKGIARYWFECGKSHVSLCAGKAEKPSPSPKERGDICASCHTWADCSKAGECDHHGYPLSGISQQERP